MAGLAEVILSAFDRGEELTKGVPKGSKKGDFKKVFKAKYKSQNVECVLQKFMKNDVPISETNFPQQWAARELEILEHLGKLHHQQYISEIYGMCREKDGTTFLQEWIALGTLKVALKDERKAGVTGFHKVYMAKQIAASMVFLEQARVLHNDLSCKNVVMCRLQAASPRDTVVKVDNFKFGLTLPEGQTSVVKRQGCALRWISPETLVENKMSFKSNVWMLGATLWEMFSAGSQPWQKMEKNDDVKTRLKAMAASEEFGDSLVEDFPQADDCSDLAQAALLSCMRPKERDRPDFMQVQSIFMQMVAEAEGTSVTMDATVSSAKERALSMNAPTPSTQTPLSRDDSPQRNDLGPQQKERLRSMGDEADMGQQLWSAGEREDDKGGDCQGSIDAYASRFKTVKQYLQSDQANKSLGPQVIYSMRQEVEEAQAREAYLMDLVKRMQDQMGEWYGPQIPQQVNGRGSMDCGQELAGANSASLSILQAKSAAMRAKCAGSPSCTRLSGALSNDHLAPAVYAAMSPPSSTSGSWSLWSFVGPAQPPQKQDFPSMAEATAAFDNCKVQAIPCMLRDPIGGAHSKYNWVAFNFTLPPRLVPPSSRASSPGPPTRPGACQRGY